MSKEEFNKLWKDSTKEQILNQYYYDYEKMVKSHNIIKELEKWLKDYIKLFDKPDMLEEQTLEDLKEVLGKLQELKGDSSNE